MRGSHTNTATVADEIAAVLDLKRQGMTVRQIASQLGMSSATVQRRIDAGIAATVSTSVDALRISETARLEKLWRALEPGIKDGDVPAVGEARRISESLRKLHGADAPVKSEIVLSQQTDLDANVVVEALSAALTAVFAVAGLDAAWQHKLTTYAFETAQRSLDPALPPPEVPVRPRPMLALMPGTGLADGPPPDPGDDGGPDVPGGGLTAAELAVLDVALATPGVDDVA